MGMALYKTSSLFCLTFFSSGDNANFQEAGREHRWEKQNMCKERKMLKRGSATSDVTSAWGGGRGLGIVEWDPGDYHHVCKQA